MENQFFTTLGEIAHFPNNICVISNLFLLYVTWVFDPIIYFLRFSSNLLTFARLSALFQLFSNANLFSFNWVSLNPFCMENIFGSMVLFFCRRVVSHSEKSKFSSKDYINVLKGSNISWLNFNGKKLASRWKRYAPATNSTIQIPSNMKKWTEFDLQH